MNPEDKPTEEKRAYILRERYIARTEAASREGALMLGKTYAVAGAVTYGHQIPEDGFERILDARRPGETLCVFAIPERGDVTFDPFAGETISTATMLRRMQDEVWVRANPAHPISIMFWALRNYTEMVKAIREHRPLIMFQRGRKKAYVVAGGDEEKNRFVLERAGFDTSEIAEILQCAADVVSAPQKP